MSLRKETEAINHLLKELKDSYYKALLSTSTFDNSWKNLDSAQLSFWNDYKEPC